MSESRINPDVLESIHKESLERDIIAIIAEMQCIDIRLAMDIYFNSKLSSQIDSGEYGIQYLDAHYLANDLKENESELFN